MVGLPVHGRGHAGGLRRHAAPITTADVMVIPAGRAVYLSLESEGGWSRTTTDPRTPDYVVIHSFWAPRLFGKQDVVPGRTNHITFSADEPGVFTGQCAEFCGLEHGQHEVPHRGAGRRRTGTPGSPNEKQPGTDADRRPGARGRADLFMNPLSGDRGTCVACHASRRDDGGRRPRPPTSRTSRSEPLVLRGLQLATTTPTTRALERRWLHDPNAVKLGAKMPNYHLSRRARSTRSSPTCTA